ncbi:MAG: hypothetical protein MK161_15890 [Pirellulales bacterium]|nr:hypothetical protein [Pirellulales bacterium]
MSKLPALLMKVTPRTNWLVWMSRESFLTESERVEPTDADSHHPIDDSCSESWSHLTKRLSRLAHPKHAEKMFGGEEGKRAIYLWGVSAAQGGECDRLILALSALTRATDRVGDSDCEFSDTIDFDREAASFIDSVDSRKVFTPLECHSAVIWAAALPALASRIEAHRWWRLTSSLQQLHESVLQRSTAYQFDHLMLAGELGLTLAWRVPCVAACKSLAGNAGESVRMWCDREQESVSEVLGNAASVRLVLASLIRCRMLLDKVAKRKFRKSDRITQASLAKWAAALTHPVGTALSDASLDAMSADEQKCGLIATLQSEYPETLKAAFAAARGETPVGGRLAWEVGLPDTWHHDKDAKLAVGFADWDVRQGRFHLDYSGEVPEFELLAGRRRLFSGRVQVHLEVDGVERQFCGKWSEVCEYSDDDVHYLEIEQPWSGGLVLQRQIMLVRDDRCVLLADSVIPDKPVEGTETTVEYWCNLPLGQSISWSPEAQTREGFLADGKRRALVVPLAAGEWSTGATESTLGETKDRHLQLFVRGRNSLYAPIWFDLQKRRFTRARTWRQLTVGDQLQLVPRHEATAYRVQAGSEQWMVYRSLGERRCRTALGKHLIADFYGSRFYAGDGSHEELVTVDDKCATDND